MNQMELYEKLKGMPKDVLVRYAQNPMGGVPQYMAIAALQYQKELQDAKPAVAPQGTVKEELVKNAFGLPGIQRQMQQAPQQAPEQSQIDRGVGALEVPDHMFREERKASGGIIAFDDGGDVKGYAAGDLVSSMPNYGISLEALLRQRALLAQQLQQLEGSSAGQLEEDRAALMGTVGAPARGLRNFVAGTTSGLQNISGRIQNLIAGEPAYKTNIDYGTEKAPASKVASLKEQLANIDAAINQTQKQGAQPIAGQASPAEKPPVNVPSAVSPGIPSLTGGAGSYKVTPYTPAFIPTEQAQKELAEVEKQAGTWEEFSGRQKAKREAAGIKDVYEQQFADIVAEKNKVAQDKEKAGWMAALETGLGMLASKSPYLFQALGESSLKGITSYKDAIEKINQNEKDLRKEGNALQRDQQNALEARLRGDETAYQSALDRVTNRRDKIQSIDAQNTVIKNGAEQYNATTSTDAAKTAFIQGQENKRASAQIAAHLETARMSSEGALYRALIGAQLTPKDRAEIEERFEKSYERYLNNAGDKPLTREAYRSLFMKTIGSGGGGYTASGSVVPASKGAGYDIEYKLPG